MDWLVRGCILLSISINAERNIVDQGMKLPIFFVWSTWNNALIFPQKKKKKKEKENKQGGNGLLNVI